MSVAKVDTDGQSDDSGVGLPSGTAGVAPVEHSTKRNKRKSAEPKRRGEVLQMKRFRWDSDSSSEENDEVVGETDGRDELSAALVSEDRPGSNDSGCHSSDGVPAWVKDRQSVIRVPKVVKACPVDYPARDCAKGQVKQNAKVKRLTSSGQGQFGLGRSEPAPVVLKKSELQEARCASLVDPSRDFEISKLRVDLKARADDPAKVDPLDSLDKSFDSTSDPSVSHESSVMYDDGHRSRPRNYYKSMSRQRRIEANARERTRVHTISAAFENLRRAVPAYADSQKLSKLAILKIASAYILALACLNDQDYSEKQNQPTLAQCVELCTGTIQAEGRARRRSKD